MDLKEIVVKRKSFSGGSRIINCISHIDLPITKRPEDCHLCHVDMANHISYAIRVNGFLNELLDDVEKVAEVL